MYQDFGFSLNPGLEIAVFGCSNMNKNWGRKTGRIGVFFHRQVAYRSSHIRYVFHFYQVWRSFMVLFLDQVVFNRNLKVCFGCGWREGGEDKDGALVSHF
jgi:hypothetical protein